VCVCVCVEQNTTTFYQTEVRSPLSQTVRLAPSSAALAVGLGDVA
jgi:hypothetical protein